MLLAARVGLEVNLLGLSLRVDPVRPGLELPALEGLGMARLRSGPRSSSRHSVTNWRRRIASNSGTDTFISK